MPISCIEDTLSAVICRNYLYRKLFFGLANFISLKNRLLYREILLWAKNNPGTKHILDVGFGFGQHMEYLSSFRKKFNILGIENSHKLVADANHYFRQLDRNNVFCKFDDVQSFVQKDGFDLIICVNVLNYIEKDRETVKNLFESLKTNGELVIFNSNSEEMTKHYETFDNIHSRNVFRNGYTMQELRLLLKEAGFVKIKYRYAYGKTGYLAWKLSTGAASKMIRWSKLLYILIPIYIILMLPIILLLNYFDMHVGHTTGKTLIVKAYK